MALSDQLINTHIYCGCHTELTTQFNDKTNIDQIHQHIRDLCGSHLPIPYCLMFYNPKAKKFVKLNQNQLDNELNPFQINSPIVVQSVKDIYHMVELYVIDTTDEYDTQSGISCNETSPVSSADSIIAAIKETEPKQDLPINNKSINLTDHQNEDLQNALLNKVPTDMEIMHATSTSDNNPDINQSLDAFSNENQFDSNLSLTDTTLNNIDCDSQDLSDILLVERPSVQNSFVNNNLLEHVTIGDAMPLQNDSSVLIQNLRTCQSSIESNKAYNRKIDHFHFSLDVKPEQKGIYKSDHYNQTDKTKTNGYVTRIQGIKTSEQKMSSIWPKVYIPKSFRNNRNARVDVYVVSERRENGKRIWLKHRDKGFLPKGFTRDTQPINPIEFNLHENNLTLEGDLKLDLQMTTMWDKTEQLEDMLYELDELTTINLHPAEHEPCVPRLLCALRCIDDVDIWKTVCLSDFIRPRKSNKRSLSSIHTIVQNSTSVYKRARK